MKAFLQLLRAYKWWAILVVVLGIITNVLSLYVPKLGAGIIDNIAAANHGLWVLGFVAVATLLIAVGQIYASTYFSEKVALDLRHKLIEKLSVQSFGYISTSTPGRLLTIVTSDTDAVKNVVSQGLVTLLGAVVTLVGSAIFLLFINVRLALITLVAIPLLLGTFALIFGTIARLFRENQENLERINALINESIVGAAIVRVLNAGKYEVVNFAKVNNRSRDIGLGIVRSISSLIPIITLVANLTTMGIIWFGGKLVISGGLSVGNFSAFLSYSAMFIWPLFVLSFVGTMISRGGVSLKRINEVLDAPVNDVQGTYVGEIKGDIEFKNVSLSYPDGSGAPRPILKNISFKITAGTKNAIVGPTAAGKTQIFYLMSGLVGPSDGEILIDGRPLSEYNRTSLLEQMGLVFQDSIIFNTTLRDNIAFSEKASDASLKKALNVAELDELVTSLPQGLETMVSERGTSLSGGQKQRVMLARALAANPTILLLDDFTARVDRATEASILKNIAAGYPTTTLISITQKVEPVKNYDQIIVVMEGELVAKGVHEDLVRDSFEYQQILESQQSTETVAVKN